MASLRRVRPAAWITSATKPWSCNARTWGSELILRDDGGSWDLGYPRVIEVAPGRLLSTYYMNCKDDAIQMGGGVRHIARTIFEPD